MLAIFAAAVLFALWRLISNIRVDQLLTAAASLAPFAPGAIAIASALATHRFFATRRTLRSRRAVAIVPADEFDAEPEAVLRFAAQLADTERRVTGWIDRRASAIRIQLTSDAEHRLIYLLEVPERSIEALRMALRTFEGVEERPAAEVLSEAKPGERALLRTELVLDRPSVEPLARLAPKPDPLQPFAAAIGRLHSEGEAASVCVDLLPTSGFRARRLRRRLRREARRIHGERRDWAALLNGDERRRGRPDPEEQVERRGAVQAVDAKLRDSGELFEAQILLRCEAPTSGLAKVAMSSLLAAFRPLADRNRLRASGLLIPGLAFIGSDFPLRRRGFDRRFATGFFRPAKKTILTARELAGFLKPPTVHCGPRNILRSGALLAPPPDLPTFEAGNPELIPLGRVRDETGERVVAVRVADTFSSYIAGRSRFGKTETAIAQFVHLVRSGHGGLFLDPHGDALGRIDPYLDEPGVAERVVRIDLGPGSSPAALPGWNLFDLRGARDRNVEGRVEAIVDAFASAMEWGERSTRAINLTTQAAAALASVAAVVPTELTPTIFQIPTILSDPEWRQAVLPILPRSSRRFWTGRFPLLAADAITPITNMVDRLRASTPIATFLGQSRCTFEPRRAMDERQIVLVCPGTGGTRERAVANLIAFGLLHAGRSRADTPPAKRRLFWPFFDEAQSYDGGASDSLAGLVEQCPKFGVRATFLNQNPERLSGTTLNALTTNRSHSLVSGLNSHAAALLTKEWGGQPSPAAITRLERFRFIAQVTFKGSLSDPFALGGVRVEDVAEVAGRRECEGRQHGEGPRRAATEVAAHLDSLDDRILAALRSGGAKGRPHGHDEGRSRPRRQGPVRIARRPE
ncbi:MAG TPA: hypothetical protein VK471_11705 [Solirubrobacterales bacterium]|nr:hypothetical protein [Solirubrobacterales bacterium]